MLSLKKSSKMPMTEGNFDLKTKVQLYGILLKKPFGHHSTKWSKRFFIIKDGFLLYYAENEKKEFEKRKVYSVHPKGAIPLGGCTIDAVQEPGHPHCIHIKNKDDFDGMFVLAADAAWEQEKWVNMLRQAARITWNNAQLGEAMIQQLENQGLQMAREKQDYYDQLQNETIALQDEKEKTEELERVKDELETQKHELEEVMTGLKSEYNQVKEELSDTLNYMKKVEDERLALTEATNLLQKDLEELFREKDKTIAELKERETVAQKLAEENISLSQATEELKNNLKTIDQEKEKTLADLRQHESKTEMLTVENRTLNQTTDELRSNLLLIEERTQRLLEEKALAEERLQARELERKLLEEEKEAYNEQARELQESIKDLTAQKQITEQELREEVQARIDTERRLRQAEEALGRLGKKVTEGGNRYTDEEKQEMDHDVKSLKRYFEALASEEQLSAQMPVIMKNAVYARKTYMRRAQTLKINRKKKSRSAGTVDDLDIARLVEGKASSAVIKRAATFMARDPKFRHTAFDKLTIANDTAVTVL